MKVAQFESTDGFCVGVWHKGAWVNYTKAEAFFALCVSHVAVERSPTVGFLIDAGGFDPHRMKEVLEFVDQTQLGNLLRISKKAMFRAPL